MDVPGTTLANGDQDEQLRKRDPSHSRESTNSGDEQHEDVCQEDHEEEDEDGEDEDEEPRLKYIRLTRQLPTIYRGGDATSTFVAAGDKLVCYLFP
jgi:vacuolar protein sorting-associated protein 41